jgi:asparagine synthase (glutamine-hydrolysing)
MIGGYIFHAENADIMDRLDKTLGQSAHRTPCGNTGFLFFDHPFSDTQTAVYSSDSLILLTQDLLVTCDADGNYHALDLCEDFSGSFRRKKMEALRDIVSDYRLVSVERRDGDTDVCLVSNRAGNGRMYYYTMESGILFSSDLRLLLKIVPFDMNDVGVYAILKYGAIPEPMTISRNIAAVPPAHYLHADVRRGTHRIGSYFQFEFPCDKCQSTAPSFDSALQPAKERLRKSAQFLRQRHPAILLSGGIDSSLYALYLNECREERLTGIHCTFGEHDPEFPFAQMLAEKVSAQFLVGRMERKDALSILNDTVALTGHPFSDFSSLPITFILKFMKAQAETRPVLIEGNGGDDCFGFSALAAQGKTRVKALFPKACKDAISVLFKNSERWQVESEEGFLARVLALADVHEINPLNYFLVLTPINFLALRTYRSWDTTLDALMEGVFSRCTKADSADSYHAQVTIRQLLHVNSRRWAAKAYSVGESLGIRTVYPYIWRDILVEQGRIPWQAKINNGVVKWPLKRLLEEHMPADFVYRQKSGFVPPFAQWLTAKDFSQMVREILLASETAIGRIVPARIIEDVLHKAVLGKSLRHSVLNFLWGALFTEMWIHKHKGNG